MFDCIVLPLWCHDDSPSLQLMDQSTEHYGIEEADLIILDELIEAEELKMSSEEQEDSQKDGSEKKDDGQQSETSRNFYSLIYITETSI